MADSLEPDNLEPAYPIIWAFIDRPIKVIWLTRDGQTVKEQMITATQCEEPK